MTPSQGLQHLYVYCNDTVGIMAENLTIWFTYDSIPPTFSSHVMNPSPPNEDQDVTINVTINESNLDTVMLDFNGTNYTVTTSFGDEYYYNITSGNYTAHDQLNYTWYANDTAGNHNTSYIQQFTVANQQPATPTLIFPGNNSNISTTNVTFQYTSSDSDDEDTLTYYIYMNNILNTSTASQSIDINFTDGVYNWTVRADDGYENSTDSDNYTFTIDTTYPTLQIYSPIPANYSTTDLWLNYTYTETNPESCWYDYNGSNSTIFSCDQNQSFSGLDNQESTITLYINDTAGNMNSSSVTFTVDTTPPQIQFENPTPDDENTTPETSVEINVSIIESDLGQVIWDWNGTNYTLYNDSLMLMMNFDNVSALGEDDSYVVDLSGYGNNGVVTGATVNTSDCKFGNCFSFGGDGDNINITDDASTSGLSAITVSFWVNFRDLGPGAADYNFIVSKSNWGSQREWRFRTHHSTASPANAVIWHISNDSNSPEAANTVYVSKNDLSTDTWYHFTGTYDDNDGDSLKLYINGALNDSGTGEPDGIFDGSASLALGSSSDNGGGGSVDDFNGLIDELRIWNRSLSESEIQQLYYSNLNKYDADKWLFYSNQSNLTDGNYTYQAHAADNLSNWNSTEQRTVTIDTTYPTLQIYSPTPTNYSTTDLWLNYTYTETNPESCWYDYNGSNSTLFSCDQNQSFSGLNNQESTITLYMNDTAGNTNSSSATFTVDTLNPNATIAACCSTSHIQMAPWSPPQPHSQTR
jgi:hypothetical protein